MAWNYAVCWLCIFPFELLCGGYVMSYWISHDKIPLPVWISIFYVAIIAINLCGVLGYGEAEYVFSFIKVAAVIAFIIMGIVIDAGGSPSHKVYGAMYWKDPGSVPSETCLRYRCVQ
jgi:yeast amino acid transporter